MRSAFSAIRFLEENQDKIKGAAVEGVKPSFDAIASGDYKVSRPLFIYAKKQHVGVIPGMQEFMDEFVPTTPWVKTDTCRPRV